MTKLARLSRAFVHWNTANEKARLYLAALGSKSKEYINARRWELCWQAAYFK